MPSRSLFAIRFRQCSWLIPVVMGMLVASLAANPAPLLPLAHAYRSLCERYPFLALVTFHAPALPLVLLLLLAGLGLLVGTWAGVTGLIGTYRFNRHVRRTELLLPSHLLQVGADLGISDRLTYLAWEKPAACCYGFIRPRIAVTAALVSRLDDKELLAVLAHERQHLHCRDPLRYLVLHALTAAAFMFPVAPALRRRQEARIELATDRAALAVAPRGALAGAMLVVLKTSPVPAPGTAWLSVTEARIAHLSGRSFMPEIPARPAVASVGLALIIITSTINLAAASSLVEIVCAFCAGGS